MTDRLNPAVMPPDSLPNEALGHWAAKIRKGTTKLLEDTLALCRDVRDAREALGEDGFRQLADLTDLSISTLFRMSRIGGHFQSFAPVQLPSDYSVLYELTQLPMHEIEAGIEAGVIHPGASRRDLASWKLARQAEAEAEAAEGELLTALGRSVEELLDDYAHEKRELAALRNEASRQVSARMAEMARMRRDLSERGVNQRTLAVAMRARGV